MAVGDHGEIGHALNVHLQDYKRGKELVINPNRSMKELVVSILTIPQPHYTRMVKKKKEHRLNLKVNPVKTILVQVK